MKEIVQRFTTSRWLFAYLTLFPIVMMLLAVFYFEGVLGLEPCPLCVVQRVFTISIAIIAGIALLHNPAVLGRRIYAGLLMVPILLGVVAAIRHLWLQSLPPDLVPECGPGLDYMMEVLSLFEVLQEIFKGSGECADVLWSFLGLSIPAWTLVAFLVLLAGGLYQLLRKA